MECKVCAGIVLFHPDIDRLKQNIAAVEPQVDKLILINNASEDIEMLKEVFPDTDIAWINNERNLGIAAALNQLMVYAQNHGYGWALTLDQDSICDENLVSELRRVLQIFDENDYGTAAMVSPRIIERGIEREQLLNREKLIDIDASAQLSDIYQKDIEIAKTCITSGTLTNVSAVLDTGGFNELLFIDDVDHDMCIRLRLSGYKILRAKNAVLDQEYGARLIRRKILHRQFEYHYYSPFRVYYQARNMLYMVRKYKGEYNRTWTECYLRQIIAFAIKFIYEPERLKRLCAFIKGYFTGMFMRIE